MRLLSQHTQCAQEVAISQSTLSNICWFDFGIKDNWLAFGLKFRDALPLELGVVVLELLSISAKTVVVVLEVRVSELLLFFFALFERLLVVLHF